MRHITYQEIKDLVTLSSCIEPVKEAFRRYSSPPSSKGMPVANIPPVQHLEMPYAGSSALHIKSGHLPPMPFSLVKIASTFPMNSRRSPPVPSINGVIVVFSMEDGAPIALLDDRAWITQARTAAAGAIVVDLFARPDARVLGIIGSGVQARLQSQAALLARPGIRELLVWGRTSQHVIRFVNEMQALFPHVRMRAETTPEHVARASDILVTATYAQKPLVDKAWLPDGIVVIAMGADSAHKTEVDPGAMVEVGTLLVVDSKKQNQELGEVGAAIRSGLCDSSRMDVELGEALLDSKPWRRDRAEQKVIGKLTGVAAQEILVCDMILRELSLI